MAIDEHSGPVFEAIDKLIQGFRKIQSTNALWPKAVFFIARYTEVKTGLVEAISKSVELFRIQDSLVDVSPVHEFLDNHLSIYNMQKKRISELEKMRAEEIVEADRTLINDKDYIESYVEHFGDFRTETLRNDSIQIQQVKETQILWDDAEAKRKQNEADAKKKASNAKKNRNRRTKNNNKQEDAKAEAEVKPGEEEEDAVEKEEKKEKLDDESVARDLILTDTFVFEEQATVVFSFQIKKGESIDKTTFYNGEVQYPDSTVAVSFVPVTDDVEAKQILKTSRRVIDDRVLRPHFFVHCKYLKKYLVCYDHFDGFLSGWTLSEEQRQKDKYGAPSSWCRRQIRELDRCVDHMFSFSVTHDSFGDASSFVISGGEVKMIRVGGSFHERDDDWIFQGDEKSHYKSFIQTITEALLPEDSSWSQMRSFRTTALAANGDGYIPHTLKNHPFLMEEIYDKMQILSRGWHLFKINRGTNFLYSFRAMKGYCEGELGWDNVVMSAGLEEVYTYKGPYDGDNKYDGHTMEDLLRFLRNVYEHYIDYRITIVETYIEIENLWPFFIDRVYELIIMKCA